MEPEGSTVIKPDKTTTYTLTGYNSIGIITGTTQVIVETEAGTGKPDIIITDVYKVVTADGVKIGYTIENRGDITAPGSNSRLYTNGTYRDIDKIESIAPGQKIDSFFYSYYYNPTENIIEIYADADNNIAENNEKNNTIAYDFPVLDRYDFIDDGSIAKWNNGYEPITFGESGITGKGLAMYSENRNLEDASGPGRYLQTQPQATYGGLITGDYFIGHPVKSGDYFYALAGLLEGAVAGDVVFQVYIREKGQTEWIALGDGMEDIYDYRIKSIIIPIPSQYYDKQVDFRLKVQNASEPLQNWAVWVQAKIIR
jgi:hypothetical protein